MKIAVFLATLFTTLLPLLASAMPVMKKPHARDEGNGAFTVMALRSGSPIHYLPVQAGGQRFFLGGKPSTYCPTFVAKCPPGNETVFIEGVYLVSHFHPDSNYLDCVF